MTTGNMKYRRAQPNKFPHQTKTTTITKQKQKNKTNTIKQIMSNIKANGTPPPFRRASSVLERDGKLFDTVNIVRTLSRHISSLSYGKENQKESQDSIILLASPDEKRREALEAAKEEFQVFVRTPVDQVLKNLFVDAKMVVFSIVNCMPYLLQYQQNNEQLHN